MSYALEVNLPNVPKGAAVEVSGLGTFENGKTTPVDDNRLALWLVNQQRVVVDEAGEERLVPPKVSELNFQEGVSLKRAKPEEKKEENKEGGK